MSKDWQRFEVDLTAVAGCDTTGVGALVFSTGEPGPDRLLLDDVEPVGRR